MGRKLAFDREEALKRAMESFWLNGYKKTSMRELAANLNIHLGSVYNSLGSKEDMFEQSLRLYFKTHVQPDLETIRRHPQPVEAIDRYITNTARLCNRPGEYFGCFMMNSLHELTKINAQITGFVHEVLKHKEDAFAAAIAAGQARGEIPAHKDPQKLGSFLVATMFSMWALVKMDMPASMIDNVRHCAIQMLTED